MEKEGGREGVVSVAEYIPPTLWGYPGIGGAEREVQVTMPSTAGRKSDRPSVGTVVIRLMYRAEVGKIWYLLHLLPLVEGTGYGSSTISAWAGMSRKITRRNTRPPPPSLYTRLPSPSSCFFRPPPLLINRCPCL